MTTSPRPDRFDRAERLTHWVTALLFGMVIATALALYVPTLATVIGRRPAMKALHVWCGLALPVPLLVSVAGRWGSAMRADLGRLNRWSPADWRWLRSLGRDPFAAEGKFNGGQKLNSALLAGAVPVMAATGVVMRWFSPFPLEWRRGATFVHDWLGLTVMALIAGHVVVAMRHPAALAAMWSGGPGEARGSGQGVDPKAVDPVAQLQGDGVLEGGGAVGVDPHREVAAGGRHPLQAFQELEVEEAGEVGPDGEGG